MDKYPVTVAEVMFEMDLVFQGIKSFILDFPVARLHRFRIIAMYVKFGFRLKGDIPVFQNKFKWRRLGRH